MSADGVVSLPRKRRRRARLIATGLVLAVATAVGTPILFNATAMGAGYFAKQLCSEVFVAGRSAKWVVDTDLSYFFPALLMNVARWTIDAGTVRASFLGIGTRVARFRADAGCVLDPMDEDADAPRAPMPITVTEPLNQEEAASPLPWVLAATPNERIKAIVQGAFIESNERSSVPGRTRAIFIVHDGRVIAEHYADGFNASTRLPGWSIAKSLTHAMVGLLVADGRIELEGTLPLPEWRKDERRSITWDQMLRMTSGLAFNETYSNPFSDINQMLWATADISRFAAAMPLAASPGSTWRYTSGTTNVLTRAMRAVLADADGNDRKAPVRALFERIGMTSALMERDATGNLVGSSFVYATAADYARFGWLYAMDGMWDGTRVLPAGWVQHAMQPSVGSDGRYGAHFWLDVPPDDRHYFGETVPAMLHASGFGGQWISILPAERLVIVRLGQALTRTAWNHWAFVAAVREAIATSGEAPR